MLQAVYCCFTNHSKIQWLQTAIYLACYFIPQEFWKSSVVRFSLLYLVSTGMTRAGRLISTMASSFIRVAPWCSLTSVHTVSFSKASLCGIGLWWFQASHVFYMVVGFQEAEDRRCWTSKGLCPGWSIICTIVYWSKQSKDPHSGKGMLGLDLFMG